MNITEYINTIVETEPEDWIHGEQPPYFLHHTYIETGPTGEIATATTYYPHGHAVLKENLDISFYWGRDWTEKFEEEWASEKFAAKNPSGCCLDLCYRGAQILTQHYVNVDGARYCMPLPNREFENDEPTKLWIPEQEFKFYQLFNQMFGCQDFENAISRAGFEIINTEWKF